MKNKTKLITTVILVGLFLLMFMVEGFAKNDNNASGNTFYKPDQTTKLTRSLSNIGNWAYWIAYDGLSAYDPILSGAGGYYPRGTTTAIFQDGIVWGAYVRDNLTQNPRVGGQTYNVGTAPGKITVNGTPPAGAASATAELATNPLVKLYKIDTRFTVPWDQLTEEQQSNALDVLRNSVAEENSINASQVGDDQIVDEVNTLATDWAEWPADRGAPAYPDGTPGVAGADQVIWFVTNDLDTGRTSSLYGSLSMGIELQVTMWAYNQPSTALGQVLFKQYKIINKSGVRFDSMFVAQWSDPDLGDSGDDFAGCDTVESIGYCYNGYLVDNQYAQVNLPPPAAGYDFFQGPLVPGVAGEDRNKNEIDDAEDYGIFNLTQVGPGLINLPMTSFSFFAAGSAISDPPLRTYEGTLRWYKMLNGYIPDNEDMTDLNRYKIGSGPGAGGPTLYPMAGDPFRETGDLDGRGGNFGPGDRRIVLTSGPFTMEPGDTQEVVVAVVGGIIAEQGGNNRNAVEQLKLNDVFAQILYDSLFRAVPKPPAEPAVSYTESEKNISLVWGSNLPRVDETENTVVLGFEFEGYNVYQLPSANSTLAAARLVATYDKVNNVTIIRAPRFVPSYGDVVTVPIRYGTDKGIQRYFVVEKDYINDVPLYPGNEYYFAVTAYNYNPEFPDPSLESKLNILTIIPQSTKPGVRFGGSSGEMLEFDHTQGLSGGQVFATVVDPARTTGLAYEVYFTWNDDSTELLWNLRRSDGTILVTDQPQAETADNPSNAKPIVDGIQWVVTGASGFADFQVTANAAGPLDPPDMGCFAFNNNGFPFLINARYPDGGDRPTFGVQQSTNESGWGVHTGMTAANFGSFEYFMSRVVRNDNATRLVPYDFEMRFTERGGFGEWAFELGGVYPIPFELWNVGISTPDDANDDFRMIPLVLNDTGDEAEGDTVYNINTVDHSLSGGDNDPEMDWVYWYEPSDKTPGESGYDLFVSADDFGDEVMARTVLVNWNGGSVAAADFPANLNAVIPEQGTIFLIRAAKPNTANDVFTIVAPAVTVSETLAKDDVAKVNVFPNPYYAFNTDEKGRFDRFVTFTHLPRKATIRIFDLGGVQVRKFEKNSTSQFQQWDLKNESNLPVGSGMYVAYIDMPDLGKQKVLKVMIIQPQQVLERY